MEREGKTERGTLSDTRLFHKTYDTLFQTFYFTDIFDGTKGTKQKSVMGRLMHYQLHANDLVHVECQIRRYVPAGSQPWARYKTSFKLDKIVLLVKAPPDATAESESEDETMVREDTDDEYVGF